MLQPGSGTVDSLLGVYYNQRDGNLSWFTQALWQHALNTRDNYKPGQRLGVDMGLSYSVTPNVNLLPLSLPRNCAFSCNSKLTLGVAL